MEVQKLNEIVMIRTAFDGADGIAWTPLNEFALSSKVSTRQRDYAACMLSLYAELCRGRNYYAAHIISEPPLALSLSAVFAAVKDGQLAPRFRLVCCDIILHVRLVAV